MPGGHRLSVSFCCVTAMVHPNSFLEEEDIVADEAMEGGSEGGRAPSPSESILDFGEEMDTRSQQDRGSEDLRDDLSSIPSEAPFLAASNASRRSLDLLG